MICEGGGDEMRLLEQSSLLVASSVGAECTWTGFPTIISRKTATEATYERGSNGRKSPAPIP
jgi:hypothetical protein